MKLAMRLKPQDSFFDNEPIVDLSLLLCKTNNWSADNCSEKQCHQHLNELYTWAWMQYPTV